MKWLPILSVLVVLSATAIGGFRLGRHAVQSTETVRLEKRVKELNAKLVETQVKLDGERIRLINARNVINRREEAEKTVKDGYRFDDIEARMASIKVRFNDLQREVAEGKYPGLAVTPAYQELRRIFDSPEFDRLVRVEHDRGQ